MANVRQSEITAYHRNAALVTSRDVLHPAEKAAAVAALPMLKRKRGRAELEAKWALEEQAAVSDARAVHDRLCEMVADLQGALRDVGAVGRPELLGKVDAEQLRAKRAQVQLEAASDALSANDLGAAGSAVDAALRELASFGGQLVVAINQLLAQAAVGRDARAEIKRNVEARRAAKAALESERAKGGTAFVAATPELYRLEAESLRLAARILGAQTAPARASRRTTNDDKGIRVLQPHECEKFADVGGLEEVKERLRASVGAIMERPDEAARYRVVHNGILFHGPPGTGKTLLSRALAGEYGMRYIRFAPANIASGFIHEAAANLRKLFELARNNVPCVLFLDEVDTIASDRGDQPSADHREVVTQLMNSLEEYRTVPGLVIVAATNEIDRLDPGLREGRFDSKILVPLPDVDARRDIVAVLLERREDAVDWDDIDVDAIAAKTSGRNAAAIEGFVSTAAQLALAENRLITQADLLEALRQREGTDRTKLDEQLTWDDVVLADATKNQLDELMTVFAQPDLARKLGVAAPAGLLLHGPPGTGKTTIAKVVASQVNASFYELSGADILSKWAGESEQRVAKMFTKARANRPSIIFIDEIEGLLRRRTGDATSPWEQRIVGQFLRELDGLRGGDGVLLIGATNRLDIIDEAIVGRRLTPIEVGLPDLRARIGLLEVLCRDVALAKDVDLRQLAAATDGMSGADLKRLRDAAGMKALKRSAAGKGRASGEPTVKMADFTAALATQRGRASLLQV